MVPSADAGGPLRRLVLSTTGALLVALLVVVLVARADERAEIAAIDRYLDARWDAPADATDKLVARIEKAGLSQAAVEKLLRAGRSRIGPPPEKPGELASVEVECDHV